MAFIDEMEALAHELGRLGCAVDAPVREEQAISWDALNDSQAWARKKSYIDGHLEKIRQADLVLLANYDKHGVVGYIGANSLMEAAFAYALNVPVAYLWPVGEQGCRLEALAISDRVMHGSADTVVAAII